MFAEFKKFAAKGNMLDMAVGIVIGAAFATIIGSLVADILMPPIGLVLGGVDFSDMFAVLKDGTVAGPYATLAAAQDAGAVTLNYGVFLNSLVNFLIIAVAMFMVVRSFNRMMSKKEQDQPAGPPPPSKQEQLLTEIRDLWARS